MITKTWNVLVKFDSLFFSDEEGEGYLRKWYYSVNVLAVALYIIVRGGL